MLVSNYFCILPLHKAEGSQILANFAYEVQVLQALCYER